MSQDSGIGLYPLINDKPEGVYSALILVWGLRGVPYRAGPRSGLAAEPVSRSLTATQGVQEERGGDTGVRGQRDGELQGFHQRRGLPLPVPRGHEVLRAGKAGIRGLWERSTTLPMCTEGVRTAVPWQRGQRCHAPPGPQRPPEGDAASASSPATSGLA